MKTSYSHLPDYAKNDLQQIVTLILERVPHCEMIILYSFDRLCCLLFFRV